MTVPRRFALVCVWTSLALAAAACGQTFTPTSPSAVVGGAASSSGAVITGTVNGASSQLASSTSFTTAAVTRPVTVSVVGTSISAVIDSSSRFHLTGVPTGDVQLRFTGTGLDTTLTLRDVRAGDRIDIKVRLTDTSVRIEAERRDRHGDDRDDEDEDDDGDELEGPVSALSGTCPAVTFTVNGTTVKAGTTTRFEDGGCGRIRNGVLVEVHGRRQPDGSIQADKVEIED